jgi:O-antigen biosynthesis protein
MSRKKALTHALLRALRHPGQWPSLLLSTGRVLKQKGIGGLRDGIRIWDTQEQVAEEIAAEKAAESLPAETPRVPWFLQPDGPYPAWAKANVDSADRLKELHTAMSQMPQAPRFTLVLLPGITEISEGDGHDSAQISIVPGTDAATINEAVAKRASDWVAFLRAGDVLPTSALSEAAVAISENPTADIFYSDEDCLTWNGLPFAPQFKPEFSPDLLDAVPYTSHFLVMRRTVFQELGGVRAGYEDAAEYDVSLRASEAGKRFVRIPRILYRRRASLSAPSPSLLLSSAITRQHGIARKVLSESLTRRGVTDAVVWDGATAGTFRVVYPLPEPRPLISIIVPFRDRPELLRACAESILTRTTYAPYELLLLDNGSVQEETHDLLEALTQFPQVRVVRHDAPFNYSEINNTAVRAAKGDYLVLLNNDTRVISADWLDDMLRHCARPEVGVVGATLLFPDNTIQHAGVALGLTGLAGHLWGGLREEAVPGGWHQYTREVSAVTAACLMTRRSVWEAHGGLDERFIVCGNDVDYCLRVRRSGLRVLHVPTARLYHDETQSRDASKVLPQDLDMSALSYGPHLGRTDPFYNPNLTVATTRATLRQPGEMTEPEPPEPTGPIPPPTHPAHPDWNQKEGCLS